MNRTSRNIIRLFTVCLILVGTAQAALAQTAHYTVTFDATWSAVTHPTDYPPGPHFSGLVGGTHDETVSFWNTGELATLGIKRMAEWGSQAELLDEVQAAIDAGSAETTITDDPLWTVPGSTSVDIALTPDFPLVTLVAMIAPSPDWFIGVRNLDLAPGGEWVDEIVVDLFALDAGTDSGPTYTSPDQATIPPEAILAINGYPFEIGVPLGALTFTKNYISGVPEAAVLSVTTYPNPFNPRTTIAWELPAPGLLTVEVFDLRGRRVRTLWDGPTTAGPGQIPWDGRDEAGDLAAAGLYAVRLVTGAESVTKKVSLIK